MDWNKKQEEFKRLLIKTPLEPYTLQLWSPFMAIASGEFEVENDVERMIAKARERQLFIDNLAKTLLAMLNKEPVKIGKIIVTNDNALDALKEALIKEYKSWHLHYRPMTIEEAEDWLKDWRNNKDIADWILQELKDYADNVGLTGEEAAISEEDFDAFCDEPSNVEYYAELCTITEEVTPEQVEGTIKRNKVQGKQGRKPINYKLAWLILKIRTHYKQHRNSDYRLIFDCMDFFGLIDAEVKNQWTKKDVKAAKTSYIKALYKRALMYEGDQSPSLTARHKSIGFDFDEGL